MSILSQMQVQAALETGLATMRPGEADVARRLLRDPGRVAAGSLREVAAWCATSDATVVRACRAAGFDGFQDLKYHVLRELTARGTAALPATAPKGEDYADDIAAGRAASATALPRAVKLLRKARRLAIAGVGASHGVGLILTDVLGALGRPALPLADEQTLGFALTPPVTGLVLLAISHSGETRFPLVAVRAARAAGVPTLALSNEPASELAGTADVYLPTRTVERPEGSFSISPRIAQLAVLDRLVAELKSSSGGRARRRR